MKLWGKIVTTYRLAYQVWVGNIDNDVEKLLKARLIHESDENYLKEVLHIYAENKPAMKRNNAVLNDLPGELYTIEADDKFQITVITHWQQCKLLRIKNKQT